MIIKKDSINLNDTNENYSFGKVESIASTIAETSESKDVNCSGSRI